MPVYIYETIPSVQGEQPVRFEVRQSMSDEPLATHPESGKPVRRVLSGGLVMFTNGIGGDACAVPSDSTLPSMGCGAGGCCMN